MLRNKTLPSFLLELGIKKLFIFQRGEVVETICTAKVTENGIGYFGIKDLYLSGSERYSNNLMRPPRPEDERENGKFCAVSFDPLQVKLRLADDSKEDQSIIYYPEEGYYPKIREPILELKDPIYVERSNGIENIIYCCCNNMVYVTHYFDINGLIYRRDFAILPREAFFFHPDLIVLTASVKLPTYRLWQIIIRDVEMDTDGFTIPTHRMKKIIEWYQEKAIASNEPRKEIISCVS